MLRRLHSRIIGLGAICGLPPSPPAEVFLKSLPPPAEVDPQKYSRFQQEENGRGVGVSTVPHTTGVAGLSAGAAPEPFFQVVAGAAGPKHVVLVTKEGDLISFGENRYGQTAAPRQQESDQPLAGSTHRNYGAAMHEQERRTGLHTPADDQPSPPTLHSDVRSVKDDMPDWAPLFIDLNGAFRGLSDDNRPLPNAAPHACACCGSNFSITYLPRSRRAIAFGNNHVGQLGLGHKEAVDAEQGFAAWDPLAPWWPPHRTSVISRITTGYNHSIVQLSCGSMFAFGSNTWGELSIGTTVSPMHPTEITFFKDKGRPVAKVAAGNSFTLFLTSEGRVYGCGSTHFGQLPPNSFTPVPIPLVRDFLETSAAGVNGGEGSQRLIRIKDIACVGNLAVYVSVRNEIFLQGSLPEYGVSIFAPRFAAVDQSSAISVLKSRMAQLGWASEAVEREDGFDVAEVVSGPATLFVRYRNGCVAALGANSEGQLQSVTKSIHGRVINLAPSFVFTNLLPVFVPGAKWRGVELENGGSQTFLLPGTSFTLLIDNDVVYPVEEQVGPIELPPGRSGSAGHGEDGAAPRSATARALLSSRRGRLSPALR